jgi:hypothetical protein
MALGGPKAHDSSGRDDKGKGGVVEKSAVSARPVLEMFSIEIFKCHDRGNTQVSKARPGFPNYLTAVFAVDWVIPFPGGFALLTVAVLVIVVPDLAVTFT